MNNQDLRLQLNLAFLEILVPLLRRFAKLDLIWCDDVLAHFSWLIKHLALSSDCYSKSLLLVSGQVLGYLNALELNYSYENSIYEDSFMILISCHLHLTAMNT